jgi:hypothetical protein
LEEATGIDEALVDFTWKNGWQKIDKLMPLAWKDHMLQDVKIDPPYKWILANVIADVKVCSFSSALAALSPG